MKKIIVVFTKDFNNLEAQCKLIHSYGALITKFLPIVNGVAVTVDQTIIAKLEQHPHIARIDPDDYGIVQAI